MVGGGLEEALCGYKKDMNVMGMLCRVGGVEGVGCMGGAQIKSNASTRNSTIWSPEPDPIITPLAAAAAPQR